jgi:hypothetical protein
VVSAILHNYSEKGRSIVVVEISGIGGVMAGGFSRHSTTVAGRMSMLSSEEATIYDPVIRHNTWDIWHPIFRT